ncbi:conserved protein, unknown function [Plasmodium ovale wallikeri]|uniref:PPPDE domain-containing protein n=2 Tax=Plasmodium ovale TaxID=36330 RepID=A0A1A8ZXE3_PLAOA|nr:conserved protein, unknown function [Plasmodium ovale wallikeri]SBT49030.1 conserved protein, unknown function [Plasmodium ovale wallikeri]SBT82516.1 PPPDE peptidase domain-containing protein, putative [Plasmodium ovale]
MASSFNVKLKIYDLSRGMVKAWSPLLIGKQIDGVWHTAVLVYDKEYFYGGGILCLAPNEFESYYDIKPVSVIDMGTTELQQSHFHEYLNGIQPNFTVDKYNLVSWNCNNFTNEVCNFLVGKNIPQYILNTPYEVMSTSKGKLILDMMQSYQTSIAPGMETSSILGNRTNLDSKNVENKNPEKKEYSKLPSVSLDNFFKENEIENVLEEYVKNNKYDSNEKKNFLNMLIHIFDNLIGNQNILKNRIIYKKNYPILNNISTICEYKKIFSSFGFIQGYVENDEINNLQNFTIFIDTKYINKHAFSEHLNLFINKNFFLKNVDNSIFKIDVLHFKDISEYVLYQNNKKNNSNDVFIFLSEIFLNNNVDATNDKNDLTYFNTIKDKLISDPEVETNFLSHTLQLLKVSINSLSSSQ